MMEMYDNSKSVGSSNLSLPSLWCSLVPEPTANYSVSLTLVLD